MNNSVIDKTRKNVQKHRDRMLSKEMKKKTTNVAIKQLVFSGSPSLELSEIENFGV